MKYFWNPFIKIAGGKALVLGLAGLAVSAACSAFSGLHAHYLLQFGPAARDAAWISALEYLIIWLVPAAVFYGMGAALSRSRVRAIDVFGTTAFALLPLVVMNLLQFVPGVGAIFVEVDRRTIDLVQLSETMSSPVFIANAIVSLAVLVLTVVWMFNAVKVSCNLRGGRLWGVFLTGFIVGGTVVSGFLIRLLR